MKSISLVSMLCLSFLCLKGQSISVEKFCQAFEAKEITTDIYLKGRALELAASYADNELAQNALKKVLTFRVLEVERRYLNIKKNYRCLVQQLKKEDFSTLMKVKEGELKLDFLVKESENKITDLVVIIRTKDKFSVMNLEGWLDFSDLNDLQFQVEGSSHFNRIPEKRSDIPQA